MQRVGVVGFGPVGVGIAEECARAGLDVLVLARADGAARADGDRSLEANGPRVPVELVTDLEALCDRDIVIEAISENETATVELFHRLDSVVQSPDAVFASTTSFIPITDLGLATSRPQHVVGLHFFRPVAGTVLVELVSTALTSDEATQRARHFVECDLGKTVIQCQDRPGFVANALLVPFILSAVRMLESGAATTEDIDTALVLGAGHAHGPLATADLIGLDTVKTIAESMYEDRNDPSYATPPLLTRMVNARLLGRKTGRGFYTYS